MFARDTKTTALLASDVEARNKYLRDKKIFKDLAELRKSVELLEETVKRLELMFLDKREKIE